MEAIIETQRLILREYELTDFDAVHEYASDPENIKFMEWGPNSEADTRMAINAMRNLGRREPRRFYELATVLKTDQTLIGGGGIRIRDAVHRQGDLGYILNKKYWRQGYGYELTMGLLSFGFKELKLHRIWATCDPKNLASKGLLEKCGLKFEGELRENLLVRGKWRNSLQLSILEHEFQGREY